jgi:hypothetical protein
MSLERLRSRVPLIALLLLAPLCLLVLGFACLSDHPMQALQQTLGSVQAAPALIEVWPLLLALVTLRAGFLLGSAVTTRARAPSPAGLQRFLL